MNKKLFINSITAIALTVPAIADPVVPNISPSAESADCTQPVLGTTTGTSNLQANWSANTLYLSWSVDGSPYATNDSNAATCTYDSGITIPTNPTKTGYTFAGWKVKVAEVAPAVPQHCWEVTDGDCAAFGDDCAYDENEHTGCYLYASNGCNAITDPIECNGSFMLSKTYGIACHYEGGQCVKNYERRALFGG